MTIWPQDKCVIDRTYTEPRVLYRGKEIFRVPAILQEGNIWGISDEQIWALLHEAQRVYIEGYRDGRTQMREDVLNAVNGLP